MKVSPETIEILKNYAGINTNLLVSVGNTIKTMSPTKTIMAEANVSESFPKEFGIFDMNIFLGTISIFKEPQIDFKEKYMIISGANSKAKVKYFYTAPNLLTTPAKNIKMPESVINFRFEESAFNQLIKASSIMQLPDFSVESDGNVIELVVSDKKDNDSNRFALEVAEGNGLIYKMYYKVETMKLLPGTYDVEIAKEVISKFTHAEKDLTYYIALDASSSIENLGDTF